MPNHFEGTFEGLNKDGRCVLFLGDQNLHIKLLISIAIFYKYYLPLRPDDGQAKTHPNLFKLMCEAVSQ